MGPCTSRNKPHNKEKSTSSNNNNHIPKQVGTPRATRKHPNGMSSNAFGHQTNQQAIRQQREQQERQRLQQEQQEKERIRQQEQFEREEAKRAVREQFSRYEKGENDYGILKRKKVQIGVQ